MTTLRLALPVAGAMPALLTLPQPLTAHGLHELERAFSGTLGMLRRDLHGAARTAETSLGAVDTSLRVALAPDDGEIEYASWLPDPGAIEYASWAARLQAPLR